MEATLLKPAEVSQEFSIPMATLYWLVKHGRIPFHDISKAHTVNRRVLFSRDEIAAWLGERTKERAS